MTNDGVFDVRLRTSNAFADLVNAGPILKVGAREEVSARHSGWLTREDLLSIRGYFSRLRGAPNRTLIQTRRNTRPPSRALVFRCLMRKQVFTMVAALALAGCEEPDLSPQTYAQAHALGQFICLSKGAFDSNWKSHKAFMAYRTGYESAGCTAPRGQGQ